MTQLLIVGGASLDTLHFAGQSAASAGGSGMYTALAAHASGAAWGCRVALCGPRPDPMPQPLEPVAQRINWFGPIVTPDELPRFEIAHYGGGQTKFLNAFLGAEMSFAPERLPADLSAYACIHISALGTAARQLAFLKACRARGARRLSAGTDGASAAAHTDDVRALIAQADVFFMNEREARSVFGAPEQARTRAGALLFVTLAARGVLVIQGEHVTHVPGVAARELDPTGAGDTFCGATLAELLRGKHPVMAARTAVALAARMIEAVGPTALLADGAPPEPARDPRVMLDEVQIARVAQLCAELPEVKASNFVGESLPPIGHAAALDAFFAGTLQQFGFWETAQGRYSRPLLTQIDGIAAKGSDYLWRSYLRALHGDASFYAPARQMELTADELRKLFRADDGADPMPAFDLHLAQAWAYGRDMCALGLTPQMLVAQANASATPLRTFIETLDHIGGYKEDPLRKKSSLLALILQHRPERFLRPAASETLEPIVDYHNLRSCLRIGLVRVCDADLERALIARQEIAAADEWAVRHASYEAIEQVSRLSGKGVAAVDWFFFNARRRCPEMSEPECAACAVDPICAHRKELFQPVWRTVFY